MKVYFPSQKDKLLRFRGFTTAIVMLEATGLDKIHTGPALHERSGDHTNNEEFRVLGESEDNAACNSCICRFSDLRWEQMWYGQSNIQFLQSNTDTKPYSLTVLWLQFLSMQYSGLWLVGGGCVWVGTQLVFSVTLSNWSSLSFFIFFPPGIPVLIISVLLTGKENMESAYKGSKRWRSRNKWKKKWFVRYLS